MRNTYIKFKPVSLLLAFILTAFFLQAQDVTDAAIKKNISAIDDPLQKLIQLSPKIV